MEAQPRKGYVFIEREWKQGDCILLELDMGIRFWESNPRVIDTCGRVAVTRGPLVFCAEGIDNEEIPLRDVRIDPKQEGVVREKRLEGTVLPELELDAAVREETDELYLTPKKKRKTVKLHLIPYFAWANRSVTPMTVWLLEEIMPENK